MQTEHFIGQSEAAPGRRPRVLVVDDEPTLRMTLAVLLEDEYEVVLAESGGAVLAILAQERSFDAILCDIMMPEISGIDVHAWMARDAPELLPRTIFMTGGAYTLGAREFLDGLPHGYVEKPFEVLDLIQVINRVIQECNDETRP
jgi:two-component system NtrC family sensor kinase